MTDAGTAAAFELAGWLAAERQRVEDALARVLDRWQDRLPGPEAEAARYAVLGGGKRVRAVLCVAAWRACEQADGAAEDALYELGASLELIHAYSLVHDDLPCMDDADLRRGRDTVHRVHGVPVAVRAGAALIPVAAATAFEAATALGCAAETAREVSRALCRAAGAGGMVGGQALDLLGEGMRLAERDLERLHSLKTGALLAVPLEMGALAAGAPAGVREALVRYGRSIGLAFQIADDVLDATASARELGKNPSDQDLDKSTYVALHGLEGARERAREQVERALAALDSVRIESPPLRALARYIVERKR